MTDKEENYFLAFCRKCQKAFMFKSIEEYRRFIGEQKRVCNQCCPKKKTDQQKIDKPTYSE